MSVITLSGLNLQNLKDNLAKELYGQTTEQAKETGLCIQCHKPALEQCYSEAGKREYAISGLCETCFDDICKEA